MTTEVQIALINALPLIIPTVISLIGAVGALLGLKKSNENHKEIKKTNANVDYNNEKTEEVGKAVNGRMSAFIEEMKIANVKVMEEAVKAARLDAEKAALAYITDLKVQIAQAKSEKDLLAAVVNVENKILAQSGK